MSKEDKSIPEAETQLKEFTSQAKEALVGEGYHIYRPRLISFTDLQKEGKPFWGVNSKFLDVVSSLKSEVAINPGDMFINDSFYKFPEEQKDLVATLNSSGLLPQATRAILADEPSLLGDIYCQHLDETGEVLFKGKYTLTESSKGWAVFGVGGADGEPRVYDWNPDNRLGIVGVARLVVPA